MRSHYTAWQTTSKIHQAAAFLRCICIFPRGKWKGVSTLARKANIKGIPKQHVSKRRQHPMRFSGRCQISVGCCCWNVNPGLWGLAGMQNALPSQQQQRCLRAWWGSPLYQASCTTGHDPHTCLAGPSPMSPDDPTDVIISGKRLIGQHTMSLPLIKEHSRKTKIATKHCQQSNQQQQLAVSPVLSWALRRERGWWFWEERPERTLLHAEGICGKTLGLGAEVRWGGAGVDAAVCWLVFVQQ